MAAMLVPTFRHLSETPPPLPPETRTDIITPATDEPARLRSRPTAGRSSLSPRVTVTRVFGCGRFDRPRRSRWRAPRVARFPFWSPDSRFDRVLHRDALKRLDLGGGAPQTLAPVSTGLGRDLEHRAASSCLCRVLESPVMRVSASWGVDGGSDERLGPGAVWTIGNPFPARWPSVSVPRFRGPDTAESTWVRWMAAPRFG